VEVEDRVFKGLRSGLLDSRYLDAFTEEFQQEVMRLRKASVSELHSQKKRRDEVSHQIKRIVDHIVNGTDNSSITARLTELEVEQSALEVSIKGTRKNRRSSRYRILAKSIDPRSDNSPMV